MNEEILKRLDSIEHQLKFLSQALNVLHNHIVQVLDKLEKDRK